MDKYLREGIDIATNEVVEEFEKAWNSVVGDTITEQEYSVLIWGSTIQNKDKDPNDLDIIVGYKNCLVSSRKEKSIEGILQNRIQLNKFSKLDVIVISQDQVESKISNSRVSKVYSALDKEWIEY